MDVKSRRNRVLAVGSASLIFLFQNCSGGFSPLTLHPQNSEDLSRAGGVLSIASIQSNATDQSTPNCTNPSEVGYKCLDHVIRTSEGKNYKVRILWNRPMVESRGSVIIGSGGTSAGKLLADPPHRLIHDRLDAEDQVRSIFIEFVDDATDPNEPFSGGIWANAGGYASAGRAFNDTVRYVIDQKITRGTFLNYSGASNGSMLMAHAMSHFALDQYFSRVLLQMGPSMPSLAEACDRSNPASIYAANTPDQQAFLFRLFNLWSSGLKRTSICADIGNDRMSILGARRSYPGTHVHVIMGGLEGKVGLGNFGPRSNLIWMNRISAKSKMRIDRPDMAHNYPYSDMRRFLRLGPDDQPQADKDCIDNVREVCENGYVTQYNERGCLQTLPPTLDPDVKWQKIGDYAFKLQTAKACNTPGSELTCKSTGQFVNESSGYYTKFACDCPGNKDMSGWTQVSATCYHQPTSVLAPTVPPQSVCKESGEFFNSQAGRTVDWVCGCPTTANLTGWVKVDAVCYHRAR